MFDDDAAAGRLSGRGPGSTRDGGREDRCGIYRVRGEEAGAVSEAWWQQREAAGDACDGGGGGGSSGDGGDGGDADGMMVVHG